MATQKGLGKGLGALFGDINEQTETPAEGAVSLPLQKIEPNPLQPRKTFDPDELASLAGAIRMPGFSQQVDYLAECEKELTAGLGRKVRIVSGKRKGRIELEYYGQEDLQQLYDALQTIRKKEHH